MAQNDDAVISVIYIGVFPTHVPVHNWRMCGDPCATEDSESHYHIEDGDANENVLLVLDYWTSLVDSPGPDEQQDRQTT